MNLYQAIRAFPIGKKFRTKTKDDFGIAELEELYDKNGGRFDLDKTNRIVTIVKVKPVSWIPGNFLLKCRHQEDLVRIHYFPEELMEIK